MVVSFLIGVPLVIIQFLGGIFPEINQQTWGTPMTSWKPPYKVVPPQL